MELHHNDRLIFGTNIVFLFQHHYEALAQQKEKLLAELNPEDEDYEQQKEDIESCLTLNAEHDYDWEEAIKEKMDQTDTVEI